MEYLLDSHTHTLASGHAYNTIMEMAKAAAEKGLKFLGITDHAKTLPGSSGDYYFNNLKVVERELYGIELGIGVELNILNYEGQVDMEPEVLAQMDVVIASLHPPCIESGLVEENTSAIVRAMENPYINIIGHPDDGRYPVDYEKIVRAAKEHHKLLEVNNNSLNPHSFRLNTVENDTKMLKLCMEYDQPVIIGSDAHWMKDIGRHEYASAVMEKVGFKKNLVANYDMDLFKSYINKYSTYYRRDYE